MLLKLNLQRFAPPIGVQLNITLDSGIEGIHMTTPDESIDRTITTNGLYGSLNNTITTFVVTLKNGYTMNKMLVGTSEVTATSENTYEYTFNTDEIEVSFTSKKMSSGGTNKLKFGTETPSKLYIGETEVTKAYMGETLVYEKSESSGETWLLNKTLTLQALTATIDFISNNQNFSSIDMSNTGISYDNVSVYTKFSPDENHWPNGEAYRTIKFKTAPTGDLLAWLQANGVKQ